jgi:phosphate transport system substrate-binding protein
LENREIHPCGLPWSDHYPSEDFSVGEYMFGRKLGGGEPVLNYNMFPTYTEVINNVNADRLSIGITALNQVTREVKVVGIIGSDLGGSRRGSAEDIRSGRYAF